MWDMGTFVDENGTAYLLLHEGDIYRLSDDYLTAVEKVRKILHPAVNRIDCWFSCCGRLDSYD